MMTAVFPLPDSTLLALDPALAAALSAPLPDLSSEDCSPSLGLVLAAFLRPHLHGLHPFLVETDLASAVDVMAVLPDSAQLLRLHRRNHSTEVLAAFRGCLIAVRSWKRSAELWVSGSDRDLVEQIVGGINHKVPDPPQEKAVRVTFWQAGRSRWARSRNIEIPTWEEVQGLYPARVRTAMSELVSYRPANSGPGGRLLVWHGPPGTGKTTAVRAIFDAWRQWVDPHVVSDPERLLDDADYMTRVLVDPDDDGEEQRWRLVVIEDAEELLRRDARRHVGAALGRLLNTADGLLGQGAKALILLTTNERIDGMHPALLRPGRCLARIEFPPFEPAEASEIVGRPVSGRLTLAEVMELRGNVSRVQAAEDPPAPGQYL